MKITIFLLLLNLGVIISTEAKAQSFEGTIRVKYTHGPAQAYQTYSVKDEMIRVDQLGETGESLATTIVNSATDSVFGLLHSLEKYVHLLTSQREITKPKTRIESGETEESILGYDCQQWIVTEVETGIRISYWVAIDNFDFFLPWIETENRRDNYHLFYRNLPSIQGGMPMKFTIASTGTLFSEFEVLSIKNEEISDDLFLIPHDYEKLGK